MTTTPMAQTTIQRTDANFRRAGSKPPDGLQIHVTLAILMWLTKLVNAPLSPTLLPVLASDVGASGPRPAVVGPRSADRRAGRLELSASQQIVGKPAEDP